MMYIWTYLAENFEAIIALSALFLVVFEIRQTRKHNRLSVKPFLSFSQNPNDAKDEFNIITTMKNVGLGPAKIISAKWFDKSGELNLLLPEHQAEYFSKTLGDHLISVGMGSCNDGYTIGPNEELNLFRIIVKPNTQHVRTLLGQAICDLEFRVNYQSIYGDGFNSTYNLKIFWRV